MKIKSFLFFLLVFHFGFSQYTIHGIVIDENQNPISNAHVHIATKTTATNSTGNYSLQNIPTGEQKIYVSCIGFKATSKIISIDKDQEINIVLKTEEIILDAVSIKEQRSVKSVSISEQTISDKTILKYSNQSLGDALKEISGVNLLKSGSSITKPIINGLHSSRVPVINNNVKLEDQQWGIEHAPNFDINSAGKITVLKGASAIQYGGDAIGGIVVIEPLLLKKDTLESKTILNFATNGRGGGISKFIQKGNVYGWTWNILGTLKHLGDKKTPEYFLSNSGNREQNFTGSIGYTDKKNNFNLFYSLYNTQIGIIKASHIGNVTDLYYSINNQEPSIQEPFSYSIEAPKQEVTHHLIKFTYQRWVNEKTLFETQYAFQKNNRFEYDVRRNSSDSRPALDLQLLSQSIQTSLKTSVNNLKIKTGITILYQDNFANPNTGIRPLIPSFEKIEIGAYGISSYNFDSSFTIESGLRYDFSNIVATKYYLKSRWNERGYGQFSHFIIGETGNQWLTKPRFTYHNFIGTIGFKKEFHHEITWQFNIGLASRNPNPSELFSDGLHHSTGQIELGSLKLNKEKAIKITNTIKKQWTNLHIEISPFFNHISEFMFLKPIGFETTIRGAFPVWEYSQTTALLYGFDLDTNIKFNKILSYKSSLSFVKGKDLSNKQDLIDIPAASLTNSFFIKKENWNQWNAELKSEWVFKQKRYPDYNFITDIIVNNQLTPVLVPISNTPNGYHLLHFYTDMTFHLWKEKTITTGISLTNIFNISYRDYLNKQRFFVDELGRNFQIQIKLNI